MHTHVPKPRDACVDLVLEARGIAGIAGIELTPLHYTYLTISEGSNHR